MISYELQPPEKPLARLERKLSKVLGLGEGREMTWKEYFIALVITNFLAGALVFGVLFLQGMAFGKESFSIDLAFHTATSFITNTDLQHYNGEELSSFSQMVGITYAMFVAPASGICAAFAFIRAFTRKNLGLGDFYIDFARVILTLLLPIALISSLLFIAFGVPQTLDGSITVRTLEGNEQVISIGPVASLESIKQLGSNGGGFFGANSAHPFENPNGLTNLYSMFLMLVIPLSFPIAYGRLLGRGRGLSILIALLLGFAALLAFALSAESDPSGLETRFGNFGSIIFNITSISTNTGAVNAPLTSMAPNTIVSLLLAMFIQAMPGADGTGIMYIIVYIILTLFIVGLMVGKTPEFMSMKISPRDIKLSVLIFLLHPMLILIPTVVAFMTGDAQALLGDVAALSFTEVLYEYSSAAANNGSGYLGASANTPFWNISTAIVMLLARYTPIGLMLAIAGSFTLKERKEIAEPIKTQGVLFIILLVVIIFLLTALTFFPFLAIGPWSL
jgi:K+-transporting ATPase ATPase A chain